MSWLQASVTLRHALFRGGEGKSCDRGDPWCESGGVGGSREGPVGPWNPGEGGALPAKTPPWAPGTALAGEGGRAGRSGRQGRKTCCDSRAAPQAPGGTVVPRAGWVGADAGSGQAWECELGGLKSAGGFSAGRGLSDGRSWEDEAQTCEISGQRRTVETASSEARGCVASLECGRLRSRTVMWAPRPAVQSYCENCDALGAARDTYIVKSCQFYVSVPVAVSLRFWSTWP